MDNTFVIPVIRLDLIGRCLETLYRHTPMNFYVYVIDQTLEGLPAEQLRMYKNLMVIRTPSTDTHKYGNLGHSQATNMGLKLTQTKYITMLNDDVEFINSKWWQGILDTFEMVEHQTPERPAFVVNAASIKLPDWSVGRPAGDDFYILPYKEDYTDEDWRHLVHDEHYVNQYLTIAPGSVIDGINLYCSVAETDKLREVGGLDEYWYPGAANDYDLSCRASMYGYRSVGTTLSWVFHHWSKSFNAPMPEGYIDPEIRQGNLKDKWGERFDIWGVTCPECDSVMRIIGKHSTLAVCPNEQHMQTFQLPVVSELPL